MRFDFTKGKTATYIVSTHHGLVDDHAYFHYYKDAKQHFDKVAEQPHAKGTTMSLYDCVKDIRKEFKKF